jgi:hypothetical protein
VGYLGEMDIFLETHNLPRKNHEKSDNLSRTKMSKENETINISSQQSKTRTREVHG